MSDEREMTKPQEPEMTKPQDPDFQLHQVKSEPGQTKPETIEPDDKTEADDFELHMHKVGGIADQLKSQLKS